MAKYIDIENATLSWDETDKQGLNDDFISGVLFALDALTAKEEDIVRCRDCDNWCEEMKVGYWAFNNITAPCSVWSDQERGMTRYTHENSYCSYGERKETT